MRAALKTPRKTMVLLFMILKESIDIFILGHFFGWWCKAVLFRHAGISWAVSIGFEFVELSFQHWLPNFYECWWDHVILDVLVCNAVGIGLGTLTCRYFSMKLCDLLHQHLPFFN
jgi:phosphatidylserine synthase 2